MEVKEMATGLFNLREIVGRAALVVVKLAEVPAEFEAARNALWEVCRSEGWHEARAFLDEYVQPGLKVWIAETFDTFIMGALVFAEDPANFPMRCLPGGWPELQLEGDRPAEIALLGVKREYRLHGVDIALISAMERYSMDAEISDFYAVLDDRRLALLHSIKIPFKEVGLENGGGRKDFWGEECFPARLPRLVGEKSLQERNPAMWSLILNSNGH
jgi:ribosomal protein S18 acetylase RimI-like enzyme